MSCERHPNDGVVWLGDNEICYGCYCEQFEYCPLCGRKWEKHPPEEVDCRKPIECKVREVQELLTPEEIGDNLDLEIEGSYPCSDGSFTTTISVDKLLAAQLTKAKISFKVGYKQAREEMNLQTMSLAELLLTQRQEGRKEVVEWLQTHPYYKRMFGESPFEWQVQKKEWGIK